MSRVTVWCCMLVAVLLAAAPAHATFAGKNGAIAYICCAGGNPFFNEVSPTGANSFVPTADNVFPRHVAWSRDGKRVAFDAPAFPATVGFEYESLWIENADGSGLHQVGATNRYRYNPAWSPDGTRLAFVQDNGRGAGSGDIYTITTTGRNLTRLTTSPGWDGWPDWSPDGTRIAYTCSSGGTTQLCQITPYGAEKAVTTAGKGLTTVQAPSWSPDSRNLAFSAVRPGVDGLQIFRITRAGTSLKSLLVDPNFDDTVPVWSPDGKRIAFTSEGPFGGPCFTLETMNASDGTSHATLIGCSDDPPVVDPNGWRPLN